SRAGARRADRVQRRAGHGGAGGPGPVWSLRPGTGRDAARRRPAAGRGLRSRAAARQRRDQGRRGSVACVESGDLARVLRARARCAASRRFERTDGSDPRAADTRLGAQEAYAAALERDTLDGYSEFLTAYPDDLMAARVRAIVAARREAITWRRTRVVDTPAAYWSYLRRYPQGPHAARAHPPLAVLVAACQPPPAVPAL